MTDFNDSFNAFAKELYDVVAQSNAKEQCELGLNAIFSPVSIQTSLMLALVGAAGTTADQLRKGLKLGPDDRHQLSKICHDFWSMLSSFGQKVTVKSVTRLYVNDKLSMQPEFIEIAKEYFRTEPESINFAKAAKATQKINAFVEDATENKIQDLLKSNEVNADTSAVLVNALYFKGLFRKPFTPESTMNDDFYIGEKKRVEVDMMYQEDKFKYVELPDLDARAIELPFEDSNINLLIMLPNKICGLIELEQKLKKLDWGDMEKRMSMEDVEIAMPRFSVEFDMDLKETLQQLGITELFGDEANLTRLFEFATGQKISAAKHRGYIDVNEGGCEAAALTFFKVVPMSLNMHKKTFKVDHPFVFFIRNSRAVFFAGRFVGPFHSRASLSPLHRSSGSMKGLKSMGSRKHSHNI